MPKPIEGENEKDFLKRCIPELINEGYGQKQGIAICYSTYRKYGTEKKSPKPERKKKKNLSPNTKRKILIAHY